MLQGRAWTAQDDALRVDRYPLNELARAVGAVKEASAPTPEQIGDIPGSFNGYILVEDIWTIGPAFRSDRDFRTQAQLDATAAGLARRTAVRRFSAAAEEEVRGLRIGDLRFRI